jgi:hypothetical protein
MDFLKQPICWNALSNVNPMKPGHLVLLTLVAVLHVPWRCSVQKQPMAGRAHQAVGAWRKDELIDPIAVVAQGE